jgi:hypothetical protein
MVLRESSVWKRKLIRTWSHTCGKMVVHEKLYKSNCICHVSDRLCIVVTNEFKISQVLYVCYLNSFTYIYGGFLLTI